MQARLNSDMQDTLAGRLKHARKAREWTQGKLASESGVNQSDISKIERGDTLRPTGLLALANALGVSPYWLDTGDGDMLPSNPTTPQTWDGGEHVVALGSDDTHADDYIQIRESEVRFAAGNGRAAQYDELAESVPATYRREWFFKEGINPSNARRFKVHGDSMEPFLYDGDTVLVNLGETTVINNKVYALRYGDELRIKRVSKKLDGGLILHSDNPNYLPRDEDLTPAMVQEHISIIGRVRDKSGTGGL